MEYLGESGDESLGVCQFENCVMPLIWGRDAKLWPSLELVIPVLDASRFRGHEVVVINWFAAGPDTIRSPEIRNPASCRNAGTGKNQYPVRPSNMFDQRLELRIHLTNPKPAWLTILQGFVSDA